MINNYPLVGIYSCEKGPCGLLLALSSKASIAYGINGVTWVQLNLHICEGTISAKLYFRISYVTIINIIIFYEYCLPAYFSKTIPNYSHVLQ